MKTCFNCRHYWWDLSAVVYQGCRAGQPKLILCEKWMPKRWAAFIGKIIRLIKESRP